MFLSMMLFGRYMAVICPCMPAKVCSLHLNHRRRWVDVPYVLYSIWPERAFYVVPGYQSIFASERGIC